MSVDFHRECCGNEALDSANCFLGVKLCCQTTFSQLRQMSLDAIFIFPSKTGRTHLAFQRFDISERTNRRRAHRNRGKKQVVRKTPVQNLGFVRHITKSVRERIRISGQCLNSFVQSFQEQTLDLREERSIVQYEHSEANVFERIIDLCDGDGSIDGSNEIVSAIPSLKNKPQQVIEADLGDHFSKEKEIIDLTETDGMSPCERQVSTNVEPTVIDLSDGVAEEMNDEKSDDDDVFVIGSFSRHCASDKDKSIMPLSRGLSNLNSLITSNEKSREKHIQKHTVFKKVKNKKRSHFHKEVPPRSLQRLAKVGENVYVNSPMKIPTSGLRPIIIDGSNVAYVHSTCNFSCKRLEICINYFKQKGHEVTAFVPQFRLNSHRSDDPELLRRLEKNGDVVLTPSKKIDGRNIVPYDDRFIVQTAVLKGGVIVSRDNYNDLLRENPFWAETIKYRTLAFTWIDDVLMFPKDPLGEYGPSLEEFLRFH